METTRFRPISRSTSFLRALRDVKIDKENETCSYVKLGVRKTISGEKFRRLADLICHNRISEPNNRMAMGVKCTANGMGFVVIDRTFYGEF
ncbi:MAG: hypothetical protein LBM08_13435 [Dysgonamonadaceae bacterium]|jgi:hypothetical protein|nr:hypothetical protein [Dysgonamonadaceae bacterium]